MSQAAAIGIQTVVPNVWTLSGGGIIVRYTTNPLIFGGTSLAYQDSQSSQTFRGDQIRTVHASDLGTLVSVTILQTVDMGSTTFTLLLPNVSIVRQGPISSVAVSIDAVTTTHAGPMSPFQHGQEAWYSVTALDGTASAVMEM